MERSGRLRWEGCLLVLLLGTVVSESLEQFHEESSKDCMAQVLKATAECQAATTEQSSVASDVCGSRSYSTTMSKVVHLKHLATRQITIIRTTTTALQEAKTAAASVAKEAGVERKKLLGMLDKQKAKKETLTESKTATSNLQHKLNDLKDQADKATEEAVELARTTGDMDKVEEAKKKACDLRGKYLDLEVKMAAAERTVQAAKGALGKIHGEVEIEIKKAKITGEKEAAALKTVAQKKMEVADSQKKQAEIEVKANGEASRAAIQAEHTLKQREMKAEQDIRNTERNMRDAERMVQKAEQTEAKAKEKKATVPKLDMKAIEQEAKKLAQSKASWSSSHRSSVTHTTTSRTFHITRKTTSTHSDVHVHHHKSAKTKPRTVTVHTEGADQDIHDQYAEKVQRIEQDRVKAEDAKQEAKKELSALRAKQAPASDIATAKKDVQKSAEEVENLVKQQDEAVAKVVAHIQEREPAYSDAKKKSPTDHQSLESLIDEASKMDYDNLK